MISIEQVLELLPDDAVSAAMGPTGTLTDRYHAKMALARGITAWAGVYTVPLNRTPTDIVLPVNRSVK
jgi:hypothetical protein